MRMQLVAIASTLVLVSLAGCFGSDDPPAADPDPVCDEAAKMNATNEDCYEAPPTPNVLPTAMLTVTDAAGNAMNRSTYVVVGDMLTFSAAGSSDADGNITLIGLSVADGSGVRTASLYDNGTFVDVTLQMNASGPVRALISVLDDDAGANTSAVMTAVNEVLTETLSFDGATPSGSADACEAPGASSGAPPLVTNAYALPETFAVTADAHWISAKITAGEGEIAICGPGSPGTALSDAGTDVATQDDPNSTLEPNSFYYIMVLKKSTPGDVTMDIMVHFETKA